MNTTGRHAALFPTRWCAQHGEGVISTAIAVLIMAFIGAAMWVAFQAVFDSASTDIQHQVGQIGSA